MKSQFKYFSSYEQLSKAIAAHTLSKIAHSDSFHLGLATGNSPKMAYALIGKALNKNPSLIPKLRIFQLDEWLGLASDDAASCHAYLLEQVVRPWNLAPQQCFLLNGRHSDQNNQLIEMRSFLNKHPLDLCILGLGKNGHLAFNEPGSRSDDSCRIVSLTDESKKHQMVKDLHTALERGITIGMKEIMASNELLLIASGEGKKEATNKLLNKTQMSEFPASLVYDHENFSIYLEEELLN